MSMVPKTPKTPPIKPRAPLRTCPAESALLCKNCVIAA